MAKQAFDPSRRAFLRAKPQRRLNTLPLPWVKSEDFIEGCTRCGDCLSACPENILRKGDGGYPTVSFEGSGCSFCYACAKACPEDLFRAESDAPWDLKANISEACLTKKNVYCGSCRDVCETDAIKFASAVGRIASPSIQEDLCTGCGYCVAGCPAEAISIAKPPRDL